MLIFENVKYSYPRRRGRKGFSLKDVTFRIEPGQIFTLLGPNGAGKTTIIRILSGSILPGGGRVLVDDEEVTSRGFKSRRSIGLVLGEERAFYYRLSGFQNLEFFGGLYNMKRRELKSRVSEVIELVGLTSAADVQYMRYSSGMKKRLNLARALLHNPTTLLLDEPNSGVDPESAQKIRKIIFKLKEEGCTILLTTHDMEEAEKMADILAFLKEGELVRIGPPREFKEFIERKQLLVVFEDSKAISSDKLSYLEEMAKGMEGYQNITFSDGSMVIDFSGEFDINGVISSIINQNIGIKDVRSIEPSLEEAFIKLAQ